MVVSFVGVIHCVSFAVVYMKYKRSKQVNVEIIKKVEKTDTTEEKEWANDNEV